MPVAMRLPASTSESEIVKLYPDESSSVEMEPTIFVRVTVTPAAWMMRLQVTSLASIVVLFAMMVHGPVYGVNTVPGGTPVVAALGKDSVGTVVVGAGELVVGATVVADGWVVEVVDGSELVDVEVE